jgi:pimeloyl-ACP methyl ester carboxylesterase
MAVWEHHRWSGHDCAFRVEGDPGRGAEPLLTIHPIGVGLSGAFWRRFDAEWDRRGHGRARVHPDLLGCGASAMPRRPILPEDWAAQLAELVRERIRRPVLLLVQGASLPIALELQARLPQEVRGMVLAGPPSWRVMTDPARPWLSRALWHGFFATPAGNLFYRYARTRRFLRSFSERELFDDPAAVDEEWLAMLQEGARDPASRHAVFSFLAGFWRRDWGPRLAALDCPVLALFGEHASGISRSGRRDTPQRKLADYGSHLPDGSARLLPGRNVLPWEAPGPFVQTVMEWISRLPAAGR